MNDMMLITKFIFLSILTCLQSWKFSVTRIQKLILSNVIIGTTLSTSCLAIEDMNGAKLFEANCAFCHKGGGNLLPFAQGKTLQRDALDQNGYKTKEDITTLILNGKGAMPAYGPFISPKGNPQPARLNTGEISTVVDYVINQADAGWK